jgi:outer membrane protein OmpA-like peptidoglycan-associated protein
MKNLYFIVLLTLSIFPDVAFGQFVKEKKITKGESFSGIQYMNVQVSHERSGDFIPADIRVNGLNTRKQTILTHVMDTTFEINNYRLYTISCVEKGYMYYNEKFWPSENEIHLQQVKLIPMAIGLSTDVRDIKFLGDQTAIYHKSKPSLAEIKEFLDLNPSVKIAIVGHVNGPDKRKSPKFYQKASEARGQAVMNYLIELGVDELRLEAQGRGNTQMLFPDPKTDWQNEANRRVEILITGI